MTEERIKKIKEELKALKPLKLDIIDEGHLHIGHEGSKSGGHFKLHIVSNMFEEMTIIERHKLIYKTLSKLMQTEIHALSIKANTSKEL